MAGLRGLEGDGDGLHVAHLPDQDHLGRLAQGCAQGEGEGLGVVAHLALVDGRLVVRVEVLDQVFDGDDVDGLVLVDLVDDRGEGRGFAGARGPGHEDDPVALVGDLVQLGGMPSSSTVGTRLGMTRRTIE